MAGHAETFEHTADVGLIGWGDTREELFAAMAGGLARVICPERPGRVEQRAVAVSAEDVEALLVDFLWEVMSRMQFEAFVVADATVDALSETSLSARLVGETYDPHRHAYEAEVKAVTYHELEVARRMGRWEARVILDL
jgi:SHS2 domain-containing protein